MSIETSQLASLLSILSEKGIASQNFDGLANTFHQFFGKHDFFKIGCAIVTLLQNKDLIINPSQRIACIFFLYDMYRNDPIAVNPFSTVFTSLIVNLSLKTFFILKNSLKNSSKEERNIKELNWNMPKLTPQEKNFVCQLITSPSKEVILILIMTLNVEPILI